MEIPLVKTAIFTPGIRGSMITFCRFALRMDRLSLLFFCIKLVVPHQYLPCSLLVILPLFTSGVDGGGVLVGSLVFGLHMELMLETLLALLLSQLGEADVAVLSCFPVCFV